MTEMNISRLRRLRALTQIDLAALTDLTQSTISRAEAGDDGTTLKTYRTIARALNVPLADLFADVRTTTENELLQAFRRLPQDRRLGWLDMARTVVAGQPQDPSKTD